MGVILYILLFGCYPFDGSHRRTIKHRIKHNEWGIERAKCERVTKAGVDLVRKLLEWNPAKRISVIEVSNHLWINTPVERIWEIERSVCSLREIAKTEQEEEEKLRDKKFRFASD